MGRASNRDFSFVSACGAATGGAKARKQTQCREIGQSMDYSPAVPNRYQILNKLSYTVQDLFTMLGYHIRVVFFITSSSILLITGLGPDKSQTFHSPFIGWQPVKG